MRADAMRDDDELADKLNEYDQIYYQTAGDLADPLLSFIKKNRDQITVP
jgi:hypothetical protein